MRAYFMRHGQTNYNILGLCNDDPGLKVHLTQQGIQQAERAAQALKETPIEKIIVSELPRTQQTAAIINCYQHAEIMCHPGINDVRTGFNGRPAVEHRSAISRNPMHAKVNGGESLSEHKQRVLAFLDWLKRQPENVVLVVAHEETLRVTTAHFRSLKDEEMLKLNFANCKLIAFDF